MSRRIEQRNRWREFRGVLRPTGAVVAGLGVAQAACAIVGGAVDVWARSNPRWTDAGWLAAVAVATFILGLGIHSYGRRHSQGSLTRREAVLGVVLIWAMAGFFGSVPFIVIAGLGPVDALFESVSGITTTGATVIADIERRLSPPLLLWRSMLAWLGGMGIVVLFVAVFPSLGAGAKHMFKGEVTGASTEGLKPRIAETSFTLWKIYVALTVLEAVLLVACGVDPFEALCHALTTMSTCGFSTRDASIGAFGNPAVEYVVSVFMLIGSVNFALFYAVWKHRSFRLFLRSTELRVFFVIVLVAVVATTVGILDRHDYQLERAFRTAFLHVASFVSSTGYLTDDYMAYPPPVLAILIGLMFLGGCSGSTAGGLKIERLVLLAKQSWAEIRRSFRPAVVSVVRMGRSAVPSATLSDVSAFFAVYVGIIGIGVLLVSALEGIGLPTAFGASLSCIANGGPAPFYEGVDNFKSYSDIAKIVFAIMMLLGRLELFTVFALFVPDFWRR